MEERQLLTESLNVEPDQCLVDLTNLTYLFLGDTGFVHMPL